MVHPATQRAVKTAIAALNAPLDIGFVFPPKPGAARGYGQWTNRDLSPGDIIAMLPNAAAANARGGNVYFRLGPSVTDGHPGIVMLDDLTDSAIDQLSRDGLEPCLVVETSPGNYQAWVRLIAAGSVGYAAMTAVARHMARTYGGDERAISPRQPGRLPGFTNRKPKHQMDDGKFPFVRLNFADPGRIAGNGVALINRLSKHDTAGAAAGAAPKTPRIAADQVTDLDADVMARLDELHDAQRDRILREVARGRRPAHAASLSEVDFAVAKAALAAGFDDEQVAGWITRVRPNRNALYAARTIEAVKRLASGFESPKPFR